MPRYLDLATLRHKSRLRIIAALRLVGHANYLPYGLRLRMIKLFCASEDVGYYPFEIDFFGLRYPGNLGSYIDWNVFFFGAYERQTLLLLEDLVGQRKCRTFVDIGANVGQHSLFMSRSASHVHSFEPWAVVADSLQKKIELNRLTNVTLHPVGIGERNESIEYFAPVGSNTGTGSFHPDHSSDSNRPFGKLELVNGDEYFDHHRIGDVDLIKIDVEGWEKYVLLGLKRTIERWSPYIFLEVSDTTFRTLGGEESLISCLPPSYEALYVHFTRSGVAFSEFDGSRPRATFYFEHDQTNDPAFI